MRYSQEQLNEMAEQIDIVEYIGRTEELHKKGKNYFCCCPFHKGDDTPSLCIYPADNKWYCFGCGAGSSIYDWIMKYNNLSFHEAIEEVADITHTDMTECVESESIATLKELKKLKTQDKEEQVPRRILDFKDDYIDKYSNELPEEWLAEDMTEQALRTYNIRVDLNANRIVYPVLDSEGYLIGVKGRTRIDAYKQLGLSKYINYYKIGTIDYFQGFQQALLEIKKEKSVIIFEGIKSCIKCWGWGIRNTMAAETSKLSDGQLQLLIKTSIPEIIFAFDSDQDFYKLAKDDKIQMLRKFTKVSIITDRKKRLGEKMSPADMGEGIFRDLLDERIRI